MTKEWLQWFFAQRPYRASMLILKDNSRITVEKPENIGFNLNDTVRVCDKSGAMMQTIEVKDIVEIRQ